MEYDEKHSLKEEQRHLKSRRHGRESRQLIPIIIIKTFYSLFLIVSYKFSISFH
nr:MAG TPA: hypothetical protein [Caudoviricetes sp.]